MEFIKGKWYRNSEWRDNAYCKADGSKIHDKIYFTECIDYSGHEYKLDWWQTRDGIMREASLEEIQQFLPENHPDKIKQSNLLVGRYVKTKDGEYLLLTKSQDNGGFYVNNSSRFIDLHYINNPNNLKNGYKLMPEGFNPDTVSKELTIDDLVEGEIYKVTTEKFNIIHKFSKYSNSNNYATFQCFLRIEDKCFSSVSNGLTNYPHYVWVATTPQEKKHLNVCIKQNKFIPQDQLDLYDDNTFELKTVMKEQPKYDYEVVHCTTQEEWDFVCNKIDSRMNNWFAKNGYGNKKSYCIDITNCGNSCSLEHYQSKANTKIYSFQEWCDKFGYIMEVKEESIPEYVECVNSWFDVEWTTGKIYKTESKQKNFPDSLSVRGNSGTVFHVYSWDIRKGTTYGFRISTKEAFDKQNQKQEYQVGDWVTDDDGKSIFKYGCYKDGEHYPMVGDYYNSDGTIRGNMTGDRSIYFGTNLRKALPYEIPNYPISVDSAKSEEFVLPEKWCIKITLDNLDTFNHWRTVIKGHSNPVSLSEKFLCENGMYNYDARGTEITFEQFQKYVLKSEPIQSIQPNEPKTMSKEELIEEAKRRYPKNTHFKCASYPTNIRFSLADFFWEGDNLRTRTIIPEREDEPCSNYVYCSGKWAEIISTPESKHPIYKYKIGDEVTVTRDKSRDSQQTGFYGKTGEFDQIRGVCGLSGEIKDYKVINGINYYNLDFCMSGEFIREDVLDILLPEKECTPTPTSKTPDKQVRLSNINEETKIKINFKQSIKI